MRLYYLQSQYVSNKHKVVKALYDDEVFRFNEGVLSPFYVLNIDEVDPFNKALCLDLVRTANKVDEAGEGKYYINSGGILMEKEGWVEKVEEIF